MNISGRLVDAFLALEETQRFSVAAERCHVSPSAFSQMIARLEQQVGARLFDRDTRNVSLTPEGKVFSEGAHRIAAEIRRTVTELRDRVECKAGRVSLAALPSAAADWVPHQMATFRARNPGVELRLWDVVSERCLEMIRRNDADFGINALPGPESEFDSQLLFKEPFYLLCASSDSLASAASVPLKALKGRMGIQTVRSGSMWQYSQLLMLRAHMRDAGFEVTQLGALAGLVANGFGVGFVPRSALRLCRREGVVAVPLAVRNIHRPIYLVRYRDRSLSVAAELLWRQFQQQTG